MQLAAPGRESGACRPQREPGTTARSSCRCKPLWPCATLGRWHAGLHHQAAPYHGAPRDLQQVRGQQLLPRAPLPLGAQVGATGGTQASPRPWPAGAAAGGAGGRGERGGAQQPSASPPVQQGALVSPAGGRPLAKAQAHGRRAGSVMSPWVWVASSLDASLARAAGRRGVNASAAARCGDRLRLQALRHHRGGRHGGGVEVQPRAGCCSGAGPGRGRWRRGGGPAGPGRGARGGAIGAGWGWHGRRGCGRPAGTRQAGLCARPAPRRARAGGHRPHVGRGRHPGRTGCWPRSLAQRSRRAARGGGAQAQANAPL